MTDNRFLFNRRDMMAGVSGLGALSLLPLSACGSRTLPPLALDGRVITTEAQDYEAWRSGLVWQSRKPVRYPAMIVRPNSAEAVQQDHQLARPLAVRRRHAGSVEPVSREHVGSPVAGSQGRRGRHSAGGACR